MNNNWHKKEKPLLGLTGLGGGADSLAVVSGAVKTYIDDVFSTYIYDGDGNSSHQITNNIDLTGDGGMVWIKRRDGTYDNWLMDSARGGTKMISSNSTAVEATNNAITSFNSDGFTLGNEGQTNASGTNMASWTFKKKEGYCDIVTYTGDGVNGRTVSHSLGSVPGMILVKNLSDTDSWAVYHRDLGNTKALRLDTNAAAQASANWWYNTSPTSTEFTLGYGGETNGNGYNYVAYVFSGGKGSSDYAVDFDGSSDSLSLAATSDFNMGTGDFTFEFWMNPDNTSNAGPMALGGYTIAGGWELFISSGQLKWYFHDGTSATYRINGPSVTANVWTHVALVRASDVVSLYVNGKREGGYNASGQSVGHGSNNYLTIGSSNASGSPTSAIDAQISNVRVVKGQAIYKSNFNVPQDPLTQTSQNAVSSNVKLICCNGSTTTSSTVTPVTITENGSPSVTSNNSIFNDTASYVFGADGDKSIIQCGSYIGDTSYANPEVNLGWEPQFIILKESSDSGNNWRLYDSMRGIVTGGDDAELYPSTSDEEDPNNEFLELTSTGFKLQTTDSAVNDGGQTYIYFCIRRPDGYVGKPPSAGTDVFTMDVGNGSSTIPSHDSGFPVDFAFVKQFAGTTDWDTSARLMSEFFVKTNTTANEAASVGYTFDSNVGWGSASWLDSAVQSWMWKRGKGFDAVTYDGDGSWGRQIRHSMNQVPEMMWVKQRAVNGEEWFVYHKGLDGGTAPETHYMFLQTDAAEADSNGPWNDTAPTSTHFTLGGWSGVNYSGQPVIAFLFSSVTGISKVGSYTGNGTSQSISLGFQPRFLILKNATSTEKWYVLDTTRGWASGADEYLSLNTNYAQVSGNTFGEPTATGFDISGSDAWQNANGDTFIYYAHA